MLVPGTDGYVVTFVSPHSLHARSMVLGRSHPVTLRNSAADVPGAGDRRRPRRSLVLEPGGMLEVRMGEACAALARVERDVVLHPLPGGVLALMLVRLHIHNLALIERAELELGPGLNVLTGETGAGKTMLAQAIGLLTGAQPVAGMVGPHGDEAYVEAEFDAPAEPLRRPGARGRGRASA